VGPPAQGDPADRPDQQDPAGRPALGDPAARAASAQATDSHSGWADSPGGSGPRAARAEHPAPVAPADPVAAGRADPVAAGRVGQAADPGDSAGSRSAHHAQVAHDVPNARSCPRSR